VFFWSVKVCRVYVGSLVGNGVEVLDLTRLVLVTKCLVLFD
jgi:hypothetical protein